MRIKLALAALLTLVLAVGAPAPAQAISSTISGTITLQGGGVSLGAVAIIKQQIGGLPQGTDVTHVDASGNFSAGGLVAGTYTVYFVDQTPDSDYHPEWWDDQDLQANAVYFTLGVGESKNNVNAVLELGATLQTNVVEGPGKVPTVGLSPIFILKNDGTGYVGDPTDASGVSITHGLVPGVYQIFYSKPGFNAESWRDSSTSANAELVGVAAGTVTGPLPVWLRSDVTACPTYFQDVPSSSSFYTAIDWMGVNGISQGTPVLYERPLYKPLDAVSRQAMAQFLYRVAAASFVPPVSPTFADVPTNSQFYRAIEWMANQGIATGSPNPAGGLPLYKPTDPVSRQAMALFLFRLSGVIYVPGPQRFADVAPSATQFYAAVEWMYDAGISTGSTNPAGGLPLYKPTEAVSRQAMAVFLQRYAT